MNIISRREFIKRSVFIAAGSAAVLSGCKPVKASIPTFPETDQSRVVRIHHPGVWSAGKLQPPALETVLDAAITRLTGLKDARQSWKALFKPEEKIAIKVNTISGSSVWTPVPLVEAVVQKLIAAGVPAVQIYVYDRDTRELFEAGFVINQDGPGFRCIGTDNQNQKGYKVQGVPVSLSEILLQCDALINMPVIKQHMLAGISFALKNHFGTFDSPSTFHYGKYILEGLPELNNFPEIKSRTRLVIGSNLATALGDYWNERVEGDSIILSCDPVAADTIALQAWQDVMASQGRTDSTPRYVEKASTILTNAMKLGLGTNDQSQIELIEATVN